MSKLGKKPILIPKDSSVKMDGNSLLVSGPKGSQKILFNEKIFSSKVNEKNEFHIQPLKKDKKTSIMWGTYRSLINNAVLGVTKGHEKNLELSGVGFRASLKGDQIIFLLGFSHEIKYTIPKGITENICGATANIPLVNICFFDNIYLTGWRAIFKYLASNLQSL